MTWQDRAKTLAAGKWIRFSVEQPIHVLTFAGEPAEVEKVSTIAERKGQKYTQMSFPVLEDGEERILEPNNSLLRQLLDEDSVKSIIGRTLLIKCLDIQNRRQWSIRPVGVQEDVTRTWADDEDEQQKKADFHKKVEAKTKRSRKPKIKEETKDAEEEQSIDSEVEPGTTEEME